MSVARFPICTTGVFRLAVLISGLSLAGCNVKLPNQAGQGGGGGGSGGTSGAVPLDVFAQAAKDAKPAEAPYIEAARPFLTAVASRDYATAYSQLSSHARAKSRSDQFEPELDPNRRRAPTILENLTQEQFIEWMQRMEQTLGAPRTIRHVYVQSVDPEELAGKGDRITAMFTIGGMPPEIPAQIRKASIRAQITCHLKDDAVKQIASDLNISEDQVRSGKWPENDMGYDPDEMPYLNVKFVLVEDAGPLRIAYFEFMPPSMLD